MSILQLKNDINNFVMNNVKRKMTEILKAKLTEPINKAELVPKFETFLEEQFNPNFITDAKAAYITTAEIEELLRTNSGGRAKKKTRKRKLSRPRRATLGKNKGGAKKVRAFRMSGGNDYPYQRPNYSLREYEYIIKKSNDFIKQQEEIMKKFKEKLLEKAKEPLKNLLMCVLEEHFANVLTRDFKAGLNNAAVISQDKASGAVKDATNNVQLYKTIWETKKPKNSEQPEEPEKCINESLQNIVNEYKEKLKNPIPLVNSQ